MLREDILTNYTPENRVAEPETPTGASVLTDGGRFQANLSAGIHDFTTSRM